MGNKNSVDQDTTISCDVDFIANKIYSKQYDDLNQMQREKVDFYQETMEANKKMYSGVLGLTVQQRERLYRLAEVTYKMINSNQSEVFNRLFDLENDISLVKDQLSDVQERPYGILMKELQPKIDRRNVKIEALKKELETLENKQKNTETQLSINNKNLYKEYQQTNGMDNLTF